MGTLDDYQQRSLVRVQTSEFGSMRHLREIPERMEQDWQKAKEGIKQALRNTELRADAQQSRIAAARNDALDALERRANEARERAERVQADMRQVIQSHEKMAVGGLDQTMMLRYWQRTEKALERGESPNNVIEDASDMPTYLETLHEELPDYLRSKGMDEKTIGSFMEAVEQKRLALAPEHIREAHQLREEAAYLRDGLAYRKALYSQRVHAGQLFEEARGELRAAGGYVQHGQEPPRPVEGHTPGWVG